MTTVAAAIYENGVLRPLSPLPLAEGARVEVTVTDHASSPPTEVAGDAADLLHAVAALPIRSLEGHRVVTPVISQADLGEEMFGRQ